MQRRKLDLIFGGRRACLCLRLQGRNQVSRPGLDPSANRSRLDAQSITCNSSTVTMDPIHEAKFPLHEAAREGKSAYSLSHTSQLSLTDDFQLKLPNLSSVCVLRSCPASSSELYTTLLVARSLSLMRPRQTPSSQMSRMMMSVSPSTGR